MKTMLITLKNGEQLRIPCHHVDDDGWNLKCFDQNNELIAFFDRSEISSCYPVND